MKEAIARHLVIIRHGESEGDVRRRERELGRNYRLSKQPHQEEQTELGRAQSQAAGRWIVEYILKHYGIEKFDFCAVSPTIRTQQSAVSLSVGDHWAKDPLLDERNRGKIQGMTKEEHQRLYPNNYICMEEDPVGWVPPGGESIAGVVKRAQKFLNFIRNSSAAIVVTHRDWMWASLVPLEGYSDEELASYDTDAIGNAQLIHYTNVNPNDNSVCSPDLVWKRTVCPWEEEPSVKYSSDSWIDISGSTTSGTRQ